MHAALENGYKITEPTIFLEMDVNHEDTCVKTPKPQQKDIGILTFVLLVFGVMVVYCVGIWSLVNALNDLRRAVDEETVALHLYNT